MNFKEYLSSQKEFYLSALAARMWPNNKNSKAYLSAKLNGLDGRAWTDKDEVLARKALEDLGSSLVDASKQNA